MKTAGIMSAVLAATVTLSCGGTDSATAPSRVGAALPVCLEVRDLDLPNGWWRDESATGKFGIPGVTACVYELRGSDDEYFAYAIGSSPRPRWSQLMEETGYAVTARPELGAGSGQAASHPGRETGVCELVAGDLQVNIMVSTAHGGSDRACADANALLQRIADNH